MVRDFEISLGYLFYIAVLFAHISSRAPRMLLVVGESGGYCLHMGGRMSRGHNNGRAAFGGQDDYLHALWHGQGRRDITMIPPNVSMV